MGKKIKAKKVNHAKKLINDVSLASKVLDIKIYISGPVTGKAGFNIDKFTYQAERLRSFGLIVLNPMERHGHTDKSWFFYILDDIRWIAVEKPKYFFMLKGWEYSHGAVIEHEVALKMGAKIFYE